MTYPKRCDMCQNGFVHTYHNATQLGVCVDCLEKANQTTIHLERANFWDMLDNPPSGCEETAALYSWGFHETHPTVRLFLDLTGISEELGIGNLSEAHRLGEMELDYLGAALKEYAAAPQLVGGYVRELLEHESGL